MADRKPKTPESQLKAIAKYESTLEKMTVRFVPGTKKRIKDLGYSSANAFAVAAIMEKLDREESYRKGK